MRLLTALTLCTVFVGCGGGAEGDPLPDPDKHEVTGTVTMGGQPLAKGTIEFSSPKDAELGLGAATAEIVDGEYKVEARPGMKTVKISAIEEYGEADATGVKPTRETIAAQFNEKTTLEADIAEEGENKFDFEVKAR